MNKIQKIILAILILASLALIFLVAKISKPQQIVVKEKTWNGEYLQVLSEPFNQTEVEEGFGEFDDIFGGIRPSNFKTTLARSLAAIASTSETIYTNSLTTKDSHVLISSDIGDTICFHINPGASNDEIACCTRISSTNFTGCTRGYTFYSTSTTSGNAKPHSPGEIIVISNDDHYLSVQYPQLDSTATITGLWTFSSDDSIASVQFGNGTSTSDKNIYIYNGDTNKPYIGYDESANTWVIANNGVDTFVVASGSSSFTGGDGVLITNSVINVELASSSGLYFISDRYLGVYTSASMGLSLDNDGQLFVNASDSFAFTGINTFSGTNTFTGTLEFSTTASTSILTLDTALDEIYGGLGTKSWSKNDLIYFSADNTAANIASGSDGQVLQMINGAPIFSAYWTGSYLGTSDDGGGNIVSPDNSATFAIVSITATDGIGGGVYLQLVVAKTGIINANHSWRGQNDLVAAVNAIWGSGVSQSIDLTFSGNASAVSGTAYWYK